MPKLTDLTINSTLGPRPALPEGRLPTLQERHESEGRKRHMRAPRKAAPAVNTSEPAPKRPRFVREDGHVLEPIKHDLGKPKPIFRAKRKPQTVGSPLDPKELKRMMTGGTPDMKPRSKGMPTLAERFQAEGIAAYGSKFVKKPKGAGK